MVKKVKRKSYIVAFRKKIGWDIHKQPFDTLASAKRFAFKKRIFIIYISDKFIHN